MTNNEEVVTTEIKSLEECTIEELTAVAYAEKVAAPAEVTKEELINLIEENRKGNIEGNEPEETEGNEPEETEEKKEETVVKVAGYVNVAKLNVREEADRNADILTVISKGTGVGINLEKSTEDFYCVNVIVDCELTTGYCVKEFITTK